MVSGAPSRREALAAIGNFDGVHRGHQFLIAETALLAARAGAPAGVVVFDPHPRRFFRPDDPPFLLTAPEKRDALLKEAGAEVVHSVRFDAALAAMSPEEFVRIVLRGDLGLVGVVAGAEFRFGKGRAGDARALRDLCAAHGMTAHIVAPLAQEGAGEKIGSSAIRAAIEGGDMRAAADMLGRLWSVEGVVSPGQRLGRSLGFPTANFSLGEIIAPRRGVYATRARLDGRVYDAVSNFGRRPTLGDGPPLIETHLFGFSGDLYGRRLEIAFADFIRDERRFDGLDALKAQIAADCDEARRRLAALA
ncbi:MAG: bifunctional riboflavin kinase/FAD synthetase [Amphiplicatus sp.]